MVVVTINRAIKKLKKTIRAFTFTRGNSENLNIAKTILRTNKI